MSAHTHTHTHTHTLARERNTRTILTQGFQFDVFMYYVTIYIYKTSKLTYMLQNNPYTSMNMRNTRKLTYINSYIAKLLITTEDVTET